MGGGKIASGSLFVSGRDGSEVFEGVEEPLDEISRRPAIAWRSPRFSRPS